MTANELLRDLLHHARHVSQGTAARDPEALASMVLQLHEYLSKGGPLPREWERWVCEACSGHGKLYACVCRACGGTGYQERTNNT